MQPLLSVVITTHGRASDLPIILGTLAHQRVNIEVPHSRDPSITCQWGMGEHCQVVYETIVCSDGPYGGTLAERQMFNVLAECPKQGGVGHHTRATGIEVAEGEWIVLTNSDNTFMLGWMDLLAKTIEANPLTQMIYWNGINNLWRWSTLGGSKLERGRIDLSFAAVRTDIAKQVGWPWTHYDSDWDYLEACAELANRTFAYYHSTLPKAGSAIIKLDNVLSVHN